MPIALVSASTRLDGGIERVRLNYAYVRALASAGVAPLVSPPLADTAEVEGLLRAVDGVVLTGGEDVDPASYLAAPHPRTHPPHALRDAWEFALVRAARARRLPLLAICRGLQVANVALGGTLIQDIPACRPGALAHDVADARTSRVHEVRVETGSRMAAALGASVLVTNSSHHQAVDRPADPLQVVAHAPDGIVEGVESGDRSWWMLGVQWHPEELVDDADDWDRRLFAAFAAACRA